MRKLCTSQAPDQRCECGIGSLQFVAITDFKIGGFESRRHLGPEECVRAGGVRARHGPLPHAAGYGHLRQLSGPDVRAQRNRFAMSVGIQQQHLERSARVEVPHLIALQAMQCREIARRFERDDCARHAAALAAVTRRQTGAVDPVVAGVGDAEPCTFLRYWRHVESSDERARRDPSSTPNASPMQGRTGRRIVLKRGREFSFDLSCFLMEMSWLPSKHVRIPASFVGYWTNIRHTAGLWRFLRIKTELPPHR